ncbi:DUF1223 domain-containing protein [Rubrivivax albus]|uniref:DUF1223 domain-containing protein n=1 Tax=Rubrivivax albus TaxID=2499835 RepID=A0A3S2UM78_9BURK|nr:DUF1223 domain-containing protein [Rubrivivax albus]RVT48913.1 DUF1223 domain-containing protein [Rubrivivax albus]
MRTTILLVTTLVTTLQATAAEPVCERHSGARPPLVVELYTSEGCSSCPPADRWLSTLKGRDDLLPLAFHVGYWNRLGWVDRFATRETTDRQYQLARAMGAPNVYTPQVVAQGHDWRSWPALPDRPAPAPMTLSLRRDGSQVTADVGLAMTQLNRRWIGYWAVVEDGHRSRVTAGENWGETLGHDHVVRLYQPVSAWQGARRWTLDLPPADPAHPRRVVFVVADAVSQRPVQALGLGC